MPKESYPNNKGVALLIVLSTVLVAVILVNVILSIILSQSRITHHQVNRIKAYYVAQAGMNLAFEKLRLGLAGGGWEVPDTGTRYYCINGPVDSPSPCSAANTITDSSFEYHVQIGISKPGASDPPGLVAKYDVKVGYPSP